MVIGAQRLGNGITTVCTLLLYRNYFPSDGLFRAGLGGLAQVVAALAGGGGLPRWSPRGGASLGRAGRWPASLLLLGAVVQVTLGSCPTACPLVLCAALLVGLCSQERIKITVDTIVQRCVEDGTQEEQRCGPAGPTPQPPERGRA